MFMITDRIDTPGFMDWLQIQTMREEGFFFESHSVSHAILTQLATAEMEHEIIESKKIMERKSKMPVQFFCYRGGHFNDQIKATVEQASYQAAVCSQFGYNDQKPDRYALKRIPIRGTDSLSIFAAKVFGRDWQSRLSRFHARHLIR